MKPPRKESHAVFERRQRADGRLGELQNVRATAYGLARTDGELQPDAAYLVFVDRKRPKSQVRSANMIPRYVSRNGKKLRTDVEELGRPMLQAATALSDRVQQSTTTCYARKAGGVFAVSCAHGLLGPDGFGVTPDPVAVWRPDLTLWEDVGETDLLVRSGGSGVSPDNFGFLDAGLVQVKASWLEKAILARPPLVMSPTVHTLLAVFGEAVVTGSHSAVVRAMWVSGVAGTGLRCDVVIEHPALQPLTRPGDSGMLWVDSQGRAVAMHVKKAGNPANQPSLRSLCTLARRLPVVLGADLVR